MKVYIAVMQLLALSATAILALEDPVCSPPESLPTTGEVCPADNGSGFPFYFIDPEYCSMYWRCLNGCATQESCPDGYLFEEIDSICEQAEIVSTWVLSI
jgi:hypothetical protein